MDEVGAHQPRLSLVPASHCARSAHGLESIEEGAAGFGRDLRLLLHQTRQCRNGSDRAAAFSGPAVHRAHHQDGRSGQRGVDPALDLADVLDIG